MKSVNLFPSYRTGMTIVELMVVCTILGLILAIALPALLASKMTANEKVAQQNLKTIATAAEIYRTQQNPPMYPPDLQTLGEGANPIIDSVLAAGTQGGYRFTLTSGQSGAAYTVVANPTQFGKTGDTSFCIDRETVMKEYSNQTEGNGLSCP